MIKEKYNAASRYLAPKVKMVSLCTRGSFMVGSLINDPVVPTINLVEYEKGDEEEIFF